MRSAALRAFANPALIREQARATWSWHPVEPLARICADRDCGDGLLGIGANLALIGVLPAWFLYPTRPIG